MDDAAVEVTASIQAAIDEIEAFNAVLGINNVSSGEHAVVIATTWAVELPLAYRTTGISDTGIHEKETVFWRFPLDYPIHAPSPRLRSDAPTNLPHINPHRQGDLVFPCVSETPLIDLLHGGGLIAILEATRLWMNNAAANELHCPVQGWERIRRDDTAGIVMADTHAIRKELHSCYKPFRYYHFRYLDSKGDKSLFIGNLESPALGSTNQAYKAKFSYISKFTNVRHAPGVVFQTAPELVFDEYRAEQVVDLKSLIEFAAHLQLKDALTARLKHIQGLLGPQRGSQATKAPVEEFLVAFAVRRPFHVIGTDSLYELIPYRVVFTTDDNGCLVSEASVYPVSFLEQSCPDLLKAVSGKIEATTNKLGILGCGSLGSKLALHLAKCGTYEFELVDKDYFSSHNNARHGLVVDGIDSLAGSKSQLLQREIRGLNVPAKAFHEDIRDIGKPSGYKLNKNTDYVIDTSASLPVRHFLAHHCPTIPGRLIHTLMYGKATMGLVAIEGVGRSVRVDDLMAYVNTLCVESPPIHLAMYSNNGPERQVYGEGCGSVTTTMSDIQLSLMTAAISTQVDKEITSQISDHGIVHVGTIDTDTLNMSWQHHKLHPTVVIPRDDRFDWDIRVNGNLAAEIERQSNISPEIENGGVLAGQYCRLSKTVYVSKIIDAPARSLRSETQFDLSTEGLAQVFNDIHLKTNEQVTFLGTWHSHPIPSPPSSKDLCTLKHLQARYDMPIVMLVITGGKLVRVNNSRKA